VETPPLGLGGRVAAIGIGLTTAVLLTASALDRQLGLPTCIAGMLTTGVVLLLTRSSPVPVLKDISWGVLPLVAGLFALVEALDRTGLIRLVADDLTRVAHASPMLAAWGAGVIPAVLSNLMNNLPAGLIAGSAVQLAQPPAVVTGAVLIGIDLGPNLSVTGSLATILWLAVLRREGLEVGAWAFLKLGVFVMPPALVLALAALMLGG
jgi:arsenical pump membrane protein